jgi:predicted transcriptional regulator
VSDYTKNDISILRAIKLENATTEMMSVSIKTLQESTQLSYLKIRQTLLKFIKDGYVQEGFKKRTAKTYYITNNGIKKLYEIIGGVKC